MTFLVRLSILLTLTGSLLAENPVIDPLPANGVPTTFPVGKTLMFPITVTDPHGDPLTYKVTSSNAKILVRAKTGNPVLKMNVSHAGNALGEMKFQLFRDWTPVTVGYIAGFAQAGYYNNLKFHRVVQNFVLQAGDPLGSGLGGPGMTENNPTTQFKFENEFNAGLIFTGRGQLAMANTGYNEDTFRATNGSQFFVTLEQLRAPTGSHTANLDFKHTIFGQILSGFDVMDQIEAVPLDPDGPDNNPATTADNNSFPVQDVVITSAVVEENNHDAVLVLSANGAASSTITVQVTNQHGGTAKLTFNVNSVADGANSPPFFSAPISPLAVPKDTQMTFGLPTIDLERDYLFWEHTLLNSGSANANSTSSGQFAGIAGKNGYEGQVVMGFELSQFNVPSATTEPANDFMAVPVGIGDKAVRGESVKVSGTPDVELQNVVVAKLNDLDAAGAPGNFTATINWGDGKPVSTGVVVRDPASPTVGTYSIAGTHTYLEPGIYTIVVTAKGSKGADASVRSEAVITSAPMRASGETFESKTALVSNRLLATFTDANSTGKATDYLATVDWGDGTNSKGTITRAANGSFLVRGTHTYKDAEAYAIDVRIHKNGADAATDVHAWSRAILYGFTVTPHLPPFPQVRLIIAWNSGPNRSFTSGIKEPFNPADFQVQLGGNFIVINSGNRGSQPAKLRFWLSNNATLETTGPNADTKLLVNGVAELFVGNLQPGAGGQGNFIVKLPKGQSGGRKYLLSEVVYSDAIADYQRDGKIIATGPIDPAVLVFSQTGSQTSEAGDKNITFKVALDTAPTTDVKIPIESSDTTEGVVSPTLLTFTTANWNVPQTVTVTGIDDAAKDGSVLYKIKLKAAESTDPAYEGVGAREINISNQDND